MANKTGFPAFAERLSAFPDHEGFVFRRFNRLSARNLLHLESKLAYLEWKLDHADDKALNSRDNEALRSMRTWEGFEENAKDESRLENTQMRICEDIDATLAKYQAALLRQHQISALPEPEDRVLEVLQTQCRDWSLHNGGQPLLAGLASERHDKKNRQDLMAVRRPVDKDPLSHFLQNHWVFKATPLTGETEYINETHVAWGAAIISTLAAAVLLLGAIVVLRTVSDERALLGLMAMFIVLFAASVAVLTNARRADI
ncbi:hypothetical protein QBC47DRAFT_384869 [Echria macrotheca]|uniref:DUF6594 domain-containing protein n=1 Tax=Echria macrotheca TaxID=438768 RepID=A0AAJ0BF89_9PEZI|nr:hypothetical protein QBC47DRAFT_384869 [Echria macrotheca]